MSQERPRLYEFERSIVTPNALWAVSHETMADVARSRLPLMEEMVFRWVTLRPTLTTLHLTALHGDRVLTLDDIHFIDRSFINAACREAVEFSGAALFSDATTEERQAELGDILFFLLIPTVNYGLKEKPDTWLAVNGFDLWEKHLPEEFTHQPGELIIQSAVSALDQLIGYGSVNLAFQYEAAGRAFARAYAVIFRYAAAAGWDLSAILEKVRDKNDDNFPDVFFDSSNTPFPFFEEAVDCLRLFRSARNAAGRTYLDLFYERFGEGVSWTNRTSPPDEIRGFINWALVEIRTGGSEESYRRLAKALHANIFRRSLDRQQ